MMYTIKQAANIFCVHYQTIRNWIASGKLKAVKVGGCVRISEEEINRVIFGKEESVNE